MYVKGTGSRCLLVEYVKDIYNAKYYNPSYHKYKKTHFSISLRKILTKSMERDMKVKGTGSRCLLAE